MQFKVPQDVQREDTIIGPLTLRQMGILMVGGGIAYAIYLSLSKTYFIEIWLPPVAVISIITLAFAFLKIHNLPFHLFLFHFLEYTLLKKKRVWIQGTGHPFNNPFFVQQSKKKKKIENKVEEPKVKDLSALSKVLDSGGFEALKDKETLKK